jgi:hypothetical protein
LKDYNSLWKWSVSEPAQFWEEIWHYTKINAHEPYQKVSETPLCKYLILIRYIGARIKRCSVS